MWVATIVGFSVGLFVGTFAGSFLEARLWRASAGHFLRKESGGRLYVVREEWTS
jgi:hypothetical protein